MVACARPEQEREDELLERWEEGGVEDPSTILTAEDGDAPQENNDWPTAEGYTPLGEMNLQGNMVFSMPPSSLDDYENRDNFSRTGMFSSGPNTFVADPSALFGHVPDDEDDGSNECESFGQREISESSPTTMDAASIALMALDEDYQMTLRGEVRPSLLDEQTPAAPAMPMIDASPFTSQTNIGNFADFSSSDVDHISPDEENSFRPSTLESASAKEHFPAIDTEAVKKAVVGIMNNTSDKLSDKMKKWQDEQTRALQTGARKEKHGLIPALPLKAFRKETPKAIAATANLTRSATIAEALERFSAVLQSQDCLAIHIVGADHVECESEAQIRTHFAPLARWIGANIYSPKHLTLSLIGPNIPTNMASLASAINILESSQQQRVTRLRSATAKCYENSYHDWIEQQTRAENGNLPDIVFCFNAGIWGYDEWKPSIRSLINLKRKIPFVVTSYTLFEAEDDYDVIDEIFRAVTYDDAEDLPVTITSQARQGCIWGPENNAFSSKQKRETATAAQGREYKENFAWQAWRF